MVFDDLAIGRGLSLIPGGHVCGPPGQTGDRRYEVVDIKRL